MIDIAKRTLDRVALSFVGDDINGDVQTGATISSGGARVAYTSFAGNLFYGDANQRTDAFVETRDDDPIVEPPPPACGPEHPEACPPPPNTDDDRLVARSEPASGGATLLRVQVPAAGGV